MYKSRSLLGSMLLLVLPLLSSCNDQEELVEDIIPEEKGIVFSVDRFKNPDNSRTLVDVDNNYQITWAPGDVVGVFPREGYQEPFTIPSEQIGQSQAIFDGGYWSLKDGLSYAAYYPFDKAYFESTDMKTKIAVTYANQQQNGSSCNVGSYDYTYSSWQTANFGSINIKMHHIGAFTIFHLPIPVTTNYHSLEIATTSDIIPIKGHYDMTAEQPSIIADSLASSISIKLNDFTGKANQMARVYMMLPPVDFNGKELTFTLKAAEGTCIYTILGKEIKASTKYVITPKPIASTVPGTTDEWRSQYGIINDISPYIVNVSQPGSLSQQISSENKNKITYLKLSGNLNGSDIRYVREMYGRDVDGNPTEGHLRKLDLSEATIVSGGDAYIKSNTTPYYTADNEIGTLMFSECNLELLKLPSSTNKIAFQSFNHCTQLETIDIPQSVTMIESPFFGCTQIKSFTGKYASDNGRILLANNHLVSYATGSVNLEYTIPEGVTAIDCGAFFKCNLNKITIPETVTEIGPSAFKEANNLNTINLPSRVSIIKTQTFKDCINLSSIEIPNNVTTIEAEAFDNCNKLINLTIPQKTTQICNFDKCEKLKTLNLKAEISEFNIKINNNLETLYLPNTLTSISLENIPSSLKSMYLHPVTPPRIHGTKPKVVEYKILVPKTALNQYKNSVDWEPYAANIMEIKDIDAGGSGGDFPWGN